MSDERGKETVGKKKGLQAEVSFSLKDQLFNGDTVGQLSSWLASAYAGFDEAGFQTDVLAAFDELELKQRISHISATMANYLPGDYAEACDIVVAALPEQLDPTKTDDDFGEFITAPLSDFIATNGATTEHLEQSLLALREITKRFSAEFAIRTFIKAFPERSLEFLRACAEDDNYHVRRLASEGTRPSLPWSGKLPIPHTDPLPILDALYADPTRFVTRSVANHLNDIAKIDPGLVLETLSRWRDSGAQNDAEMAFIIEHACRTLVKQGDRAALVLLGYGEKPKVSIAGLETTTPVVEVGSAFEFAFTLEARAAQKLMVDYVMSFAGADGLPGGSKVFKLKRLETSKGSVVAIKKRHPMKLMTTRRLYEGTHTITLQVNGHELDSLSFELTQP